MTSQNMNNINKLSESTSPNMPVAKREIRAKKRA